MYLLNGPFVVILMPLILGLVFIVQKEALGEVMASIGPLLAGPGAYLVPAAFGAFLGSSTSIACTALSRDARCVSWMRALPVPPFSYFLAKLIHAEIFSVLGVAVGSAIGVLGLGAGLADTLIGALLALLFATAFNMGGLWLDTAMPRLSWDNPIAAMKQNPNAIIAILSAMGLIGGMAFLSFRIALPKYAYALVFGTVFSGCIALWVVLYPGFAKRKYGMLEG